MATMTPIMPSQEKTIPRPYKCPYPLCGRAFSRLEHQVRALLHIPFFLLVPLHAGAIGFPIPLLSHFLRASHLRLATFAPILAKSRLFVHSQHVKSGFPAQTNLLVTPGYTATITAHQVPAPPV